MRRVVAGLGLSFVGCSPGPLIEGPTGTGGTEASETASTGTVGSSDSLASSDADITSDDTSSEATSSKIELSSDLESVAIAEQPDPGLRRCDAAGWCWSLPSGGADVLRATHVDTNGRVWVAGDRGTLLYADDGGPWQIVEGTTDHDYEAIWVDDAGTVYLADTRRNVIYFEDPGRRSPVVLESENRHIEAGAFGKVSVWADSPREIWVGVVSWTRLVDEDEQPLPDGAANCSDARVRRFAGASWISGLCFDNERPIFEIRDDEWISHPGDEAGRSGRVDIGGREGLTHALDGEGIVYEKDGRGEWQSHAFDPGPNVRLWNLSVRDDGGAWLGGDGLRSFDAGELRDGPALLHDRRIHDLALDHDGRSYAVGHLGLLARQREGTWRIEAGWSADALVEGFQPDVRHTTAHALRGFAADDIWALFSGRLWHYDGERWSGEALHPPGARDVPRSDARFELHAGTTSRDLLLLSTHVREDEQVTMGVYLRHDQGWHQVEEVEAGSTLHVALGHDRSVWLADDEGLRVWRNPSGWRDVDSLRVKGLTASGDGARYVHDGRSVYRAGDAGLTMLEPQPPLPGGLHEIRGVQAMPGGELWIASGPDTLDLDAIWHFDGREWTDRTPAADGDRVDWRFIVDGTRVWVHDLQNFERTALYRWDGDDWSRTDMRSRGWIGGVWSSPDGSTYLASGWYEGVGIVRKGGH